MTTYAVNRDFVKEQLIRNEGISYYAYVDNLGYVTIGVGRNIDKRSKYGLSHKEVMDLLNNDLDEFERELSKFEWYQDQNDARQSALLEMVFNMGLPNLLTFKKMIVCLKENDYECSAEQARDSLWYKQVGSRRAYPLVQMIRTGNFP